MAVRTNASRYQNYGYPPGDPCGTVDGDSPSRQNLVASPLQAPEVNGHHQAQSQERPSASARLEYIVNAMAYIRDELDDLKESDRVLLDIFKQLENNVAELGDSIASWRTSPGRPTSISDFDFSAASRLSSYCEDSPRGFGSFCVLGTILDSSKEDLHKASADSDSLYLPELERGESSHSCSPVLPSLKSHPSIPSISSGGSSSSGAGASKMSPAADHGPPAQLWADHSPAPQLRTSTSFTGRLASSPSITRLQDETGSNMSRNSSIDSGIQFASEAENGSANGMEPMQVAPAVAATESEEANDVRKSVGFADDIFSVLGMK